MIAVGPIMQHGGEGGSSPLIPLAFMALLVWVVLQTRASRRPVWMYRMYLIRPILVTIRTDALATWNYLTSWQLRRRELKRIREIWEET